MKFFAQAMEWLALAIWGVGFFGFLVLMWATPPWLLRHWYTRHNPEPVDRDLTIGPVHFTEKSSVPEK